MDEEAGRPKMFAMWPYLARIECPKCATNWLNPQLASETAYYPSGSLSGSHSPLAQAYCPGCGNLLPELPELIRSGHAFLSPQEEMKSISTLSGVRNFLEQSRGKPIQIWEYQVSLSRLAFKLPSPTNKGDAFVICGFTTAIQLPRMNWECNFALQSAKTQKEWALIDEVTPARIECSYVYIFHDAGQ